MPVTCRLISGEWKLIEASSGKVSKSSGSFSSRASCMRQARAVNANIKASEIPADGMIFDCSELKLDNQETGTPLRYVKELIYEGALDPKKYGVEVDAELLDYWNETANGFLSDGISIPIPKEHSFDPAAKLGDVKETFRTKNADGKESLFATVDFVDEESAKIAAKNQVSIYAPKEYKDKKLPIQHVAVTSYPKVSKLEGFTPIVASCVPFIEKDDSMKIKELAQGLELKLAEDVKDDDIPQLILSAWKELKASKVKEVIKEVEKKPEPKVKPTKAMLDMYRENRELKLSALVDSGKITPACRKSLEEIYCEPNLVGLVLSEETDDQFNSLVKALADNQALELGEASGGQTGRLAKPKLNPSDQPEDLLVKLMDN